MYMVLPLLYPITDGEVTAKPMPLFPQQWYYSSPIAYGRVMQLYLLPSPLPCNGGFSDSDVNMHYSHIKKYSWGFKPAVFGEKLGVIGLKDAMSETENRW